MKTFSSVTSVLFQFFCECFPRFAADFGLFETADFVLGFGDDGGDGGRLSVFIEGDECHVGVADDFGLPRNLRMDSHNFEPDFKRRVENAVHGSLDGENGADSCRLEKAHVVNGNRCHSSFGVRVGGDAGGFVEERHHVSAKDVIVGVYVGGVDYVAGFYLRLLDCLCVFHGAKINKVVGAQGANFYIRFIMEEKKTYREVMPGELPCEVPECDGVMVVDPDNSYKLTCDKCGHIKE